MRRASALVAGVASVMVMTACGGSSGGKTDNPLVSSNPPSSSASSAAGGGCGPAPTASPAHLRFKAEPKVTVAPATYKATIFTNCP